MKSPHRQNRKLGNIEIVNVNGWYKGEGGACGSRAEKYVIRTVRTQEEAFLLYNFRRTTHLMQYGGGGITSIDVVVQVVIETLAD